MRGRDLRPVRAPIALVGVAFAIAGCGTGTLDNAEQTVSDALFRSVGQRPAKVTCPKNIPAKAGHTFRCTLTASDGSKIGSTVTETSINGSKVQLDVKVDNHVQSQ